MKTLQLLLFTIIGAATALLPIYFGDLRLFEQFLVGDLTATLITLLIIFSYNFATSATAEENGTLTKGLPIFSNILASSIGAFIMVAIMALIA